ncbi:MAG: 23S rRNA (guanosine(2251)-2'-O)-methyltransferase RlmB [Zetaproteobacteria bacterium]|nr:MAG: 23S rRNA (guanosine(2251)-2'-O)-methyltransferase RlmB [Zetaproteobacteria bacterium]
MAEQVVVGIHPVLHALRGGSVERLLVVEGRLSRRLVACVDQARAAGVPVERVARGRLEQLACGARHQGVAAVVVGPVAPSDLAGWLQQSGTAPALVLLLDGVTDPHNLGACLRSAEALGCDAVVLPRDHAADPASPAVQKAACGALAHLTLIRVTNLRRALDRLREAGFWITGLAGEADRMLEEIDLRGRTALVLGSEGEGLRRLVREGCDHLAAIPMAGHVESLNVSVACGIALYEAARQRRG